MSLGPSMAIDISLTLLSIRISLVIIFLGGQDTCEKYLGDCGQEGLEESEEKEWGVG